MPAAWRCPHCGAVSNVGIRPSTHSCNEEKFAAYQARLFEQAFKTFLSTTNGRFMTYYAKRLIRQGSAQPEVTGQG